MPTATLTVCLCDSCVKRVYNGKVPKRTHAAKCLCGQPSDRPNGMCDGHYNAWVQVPRAAQRLLHQEKGR